MEYEQISALVTNLIDEIVYISDIETHELIFLNDSALRISGNPPESKWKKEKSYTLLQGFEEVPSFYKTRTLNKETFLSWEYYNAKLYRHYKVQCKLITYNGKDVRLEIATDVTEQKRLEASLLQRLQDEQVLTHCISTLHSMTTPEDSINELLEILAIYHEGERAYIFNVTADQKHITNTFEYCNDGVPPQIQFLHNLDIHIVDRWFKKYEEIGEFFIDSTEKLDQNSDEYIILKKHQVQSLVTAPLRDETGDIVGFIGVDNPKKHSKRTDVLRTVSDFIADFSVKNNLLNRLHNLSYIDSLTGLKNRHSFSEALSRYETEPPMTLGVAYIDIDGLKAINDIFGHKHGDEYIAAFCDLLRDVFRDYVYRIGGDEFVILMENITEANFEFKIGTLRKKITKNGKYTVSIGFTWNSGCNDIELELEKADSLMLLEKEVSNFKYKNRKYTFMLQQSLKDEITNGKFVVFLQPQIDLTSSRVTSAEALVRKFDSIGNVTSPIDFIPFYEREGIISKVDLFVFEKVCEYMGVWKESGYDKKMKISVNFSRLTFSESNIVPRLLEVCEKYSVPPSDLIIEVTETINGIGEVLLASIIETFSDAGFLISLDDFGSGHSNLAMINTSTFNEIKLDKSLVDNLSTTKKSQIIVESTINMCNSLEHITSIAEGIETKEQLQILRALNCTKAQGYFIDKPLSYEVFTKKYIEQDFKFPE
ncbi:MAG: bifunctional diguanylate cyclase/phosphodiesterase [Bacillota bacterium]